MGAATCSPQAGCHRSGNRGAAAARRALRRRGQTPRPSIAGAEPRSAHTAAHERPPDLPLRLSARIPRGALQELEAVPLKTRRGLEGPPNPPIDTLGPAVSSGAAGRGARVGGRLGGAEGPRRRRISPLPTQRAIGREGVGLAARQLTRNGLAHAEAVPVAQWSGGSRAYVELSRFSSRRCALALALALPDTNMACTSLGPAAVRSRPQCRKPPCALWGSTAA